MLSAGRSKTLALFGAFFLWGILNKIFGILE
jgi:hypothetical protein